VHNVWFAGVNGKQWFSNSNGFPTKHALKTESPLLACGVRFWNSIRVRSNAASGAFLGRFQESDKSGFIFHV
jgi:hypothetical protein